MQQVVAFERGSITKTLELSFDNKGPKPFFTVLELYGAVSRAAARNGFFDMLPYSEGILTFYFHTLAFTDIAFTGGGTDKELKVWARAFSGPDIDKMITGQSLPSCNSPASLVHASGGVAGALARGPTWHNGAALLATIEDGFMDDLILSNTYAKIALSSLAPVTFDSNPTLNTAPLERFLTYSIEAAYSSATDPSTVTVTIEADVEVGLTLRRPA